MAVLYDLLTTGPGRRRVRGGGRMMLAGRSGTDNIVIRGARLLDPAEGVDATLDVRIDNGVIAQLGEGLDTNEHRVVEAHGSILAPAFVDPHVHLRTPGREDEETIASGTAAAAAGGYCAILAIPNTDPVIDDANTLRGLRARAEEEAQVPVGFMAALTKGQDGAELAELGALADAGAAAFTDDGRPVATAGVMRRALQYNAITGRMIAVHCEEQSLTRGGHAHAGAVAAELGSRRLAVARREPDGRARHRSCRRHGPARPPDASLGARVGRASAPRSRGRDSRAAVKRRRTTCASPTRPCERSIRT